MPISQPQKRPIRIGGASGAIGDRLGLMGDLIEAEGTDAAVDVIIGDYLAEMNIGWSAMERAKDAERGYGLPFLYQIEKHAEGIARGSARIVVDAGSLNPRSLALRVQQIFDGLGVDIEIAFLTGDDVSGRIDELCAKGEVFGHLENGAPLPIDDRHKIIAANAYLGGWGIAAALKQGARIVICGRVADASMIIGSAAWWHDWHADDYDFLAQSLLAGHAIECGGYVTGGNCGNFKSELARGNYYNMSPPIAEIGREGQVVITKLPGDSNGFVTADCVKHQVLYEIQGVFYLNMDVQADISDIQIKQVGQDRVEISHVKGLPPPSTTKLAICLHGGYEATAWIGATGPDISEKKESIITAAKRFIPDLEKRFKTFVVDQYGIPQPDAQNQALATAILRVYAQADTEEAFSLTGTASQSADLLSLAINQGLGTFPGMHFDMDPRNRRPKFYLSYWPALIHVHHLRQQLFFARSPDQTCTVHIEQSVTVPAATQIDVPVSDPLSLDDTDGPWGATVLAPLGQIVFARSGDKGGNINVGIYPRAGPLNTDEFEWLRRLLSTDNMRRILKDEDIGARIERVELPGIHAVHFVLHDILGDGVSSASRMDALGKSMAEYVRYRHVQIPKRFLESTEPNFAWPPTYDTQRIVKAASNWRLDQGSL